LVSARLSRKKYKIGQSYLRLGSNKEKKDVESIDYYIVPSKILAKLCEPANPNWQPNGFIVTVNKLAKYKSNWIQLGDPQA
jgi:hypothetical protein